ncbi:TetR family transcriptional regulator [Leucobacter weissii]|uniref:TetR family transcriptional regulator n=1 Tax=Leucobacter weissii TaxID=1983706 RepID=A0A939MJU7_9MICO|nr:TetR family transcriptional regulator [Leucobacter weissii]MBO1902298.1 TetR family transcriptional regulator [Leucobacter weissii]
MSRTEVGTEDQRKPGRPTRPPLTEGAIADAALAIIDESGWQACTMKAVATRLGVRAPSLYHHVEGRPAILDLVRSTIAAEIHDPGILELPWDEAMLRFGTAYYRAFARHPNTIEVLSTTPVRDAITLQLYECFLQSLHRDGWDGARAFEALLGLEHLALGFAFEWNAEGLMLESARCAELGAPLLAEIVAERPEDQAALAESSFMSLLRRYIEMFRIPG